MCFAKAQDALDANGIRFVQRVRAVLLGASVFGLEVVRDCLIRNYTHVPLMASITLMSFSQLRGLEKEAFTWSPSALSRVLWSP